jgi:starch synthase
LKALKNSIQVFFLAYEAVPFIKIGGLGDVAGALPLALSQIRASESERSRIEIRVAIPYHPQIDQNYKKSNPVATVSIQSKSAVFPVKVYSALSSGVTFYLVDTEIIHRSASVYNHDTSKDLLKYSLFSIASLHLLDLIKWKPDILHVNDWHTALAAYLNARSGKWKIPFSVLTLHNLPFMGAGTESSLDEFQISPSPDPDLPVWAREHPLPMGLSSVDWIVSVSPQYTREIQTPKFGCGLNGYLKKNRDKITGILNGIDTNLWNPSRDPVISYRYDSDSLQEKVRNKLSLQQELNLPVNEKVPLLILVSRIDIQKGIDIALQTLQALEDNAWQAIFLGSGDQQLEKLCLELEKKFHKRFRACLKFDSDLSHHMYAGGDILLMPSRYEPCGLSQMIAMRYGCIPVATSTGGLKNTIVSKPRKLKTGYLVRYPDVTNFTNGLVSALQDYPIKNRWEQIQNNAMQMDFSWNKSALEYERLYLSLINSKKVENGRT